MDRACLGGVDRTAVAKVDVEKAVAIGVEERHAAAHDLGEVMLAARAVVELEVNPRLGSNFLKRNERRRFLVKVTCGGVNAIARRNPQHEQGPRETPFRSSGRAKLPPSRAGVAITYRLTAQESQSPVDLPESPAST